jgi:hypothetical protein
VLGGNPLMQGGDVDFGVKRRWVLFVMFQLSSLQFCDVAGLSGRRLSAGKCWAGVLLMQGAGEVDFRVKRRWQDICESREECGVVHSCATVVMAHMLPCFLRVVSFLHPSSCSTT